MAHHRSSIVLAALVTLAVSATSAAGSRMTDGPATHVISASCDTPRSSTHDARSPMRPSHIAAFSQYDDNIEDVVSAPDICMTNVVTNDNHVFTMGIHIHDRTGFVAGETYRVLLDTDSNPATGAPATAGPEAGAEYVLELAEPASTLSAWNGSVFAPVQPQPAVPTLWAEGYGPIVELARAALGEPQRMNVILKTTNAVDLDLAPDTGSWSYAVTPLRLAVELFGTTAARAGKPFAVAMEVTRSDWDMALDEGKIGCNATIAGKKLAGRARFVTDLTTCTWRLPRTARSKRVRGSISVTFQDVTVKRSFAVRVK
jgi:hypothetical protein